MLRSSPRQARLQRVLASAGILVLLAACSSTGGGATTPEPADSSAPPAPSTAVSEAPADGGGRGDYDYGGASASVAPLPGQQTLEVRVATGPLGDYLTGADGLTLYTFKPDSANTSTCEDSCAAAWPPFTIGADGELEAGDGVTGTLTTFARADGSLQAAYDGAPLYYFANDTTAGDTNGQGLGGNWFVAKP